MIAAVLFLTLTHAQPSNVAPYQLDYRERVRAEVSIPGLANLRVSKSVETRYELRSPRASHTTKNLNSTKQATSSGGLSPVKNDF